MDGIKEAQAAAEAEKPKDQASVTTIGFGNLVKKRKIVPTTTSSAAAAAAATVSVEKKE